MRCYEVAMALKYLFGIDVGKPRDLRELSNMLPCLRARTACQYSIVGTNMFTMNQAFMRTG